MMGRCAWCWLGPLLLLAGAAALAQPEVNVPLTQLKLATASGVEAKLAPAADSALGKGAVRVTFRKAGDERRMLALEARPAGAIAGARAVALRYRLTLAKGEAPRLALVCFDGNGGAWFKVGSEPLAVGDAAEARLPVGSLKPAAFSAEPGAELDWDKVQRVWLGAVFDGPAEGTFELADARFTSEAYRPTRPLRITGDGPGAWSAGQDPAVQSALTTPNEGPGGKACMKYELVLPGGRHMYAIPSTPMPTAEVEGYRALRFAYKATIPEGIQGLLVMLGEQGGAQYWADPMPPPSAEWTTITIPFDRFTLGTWTKDPDGKLDIEQVNRVFIGVHGTAAGNGGSGTIWATDVEFVP
jgi:hypothetical protein